MMEFALSRVIAIACGVMLLAVVIVPFTDIMDDKEESHYDIQCQKISEMVDSFSISDTDELTLSANSILPSESSLIFDGHIVKLTVKEKEYQSTTMCDVNCDGIITHSDVIKMTKNGDAIEVTRM